MSHYIAETRGDYLMVKFDHAPSDMITALLKSNGYKYYHHVALWSGKRHKDEILLAVQAWDERCDKFPKKNQSTICGDCALAGFGCISKCPWEREFKPVPGWDAIRQDIKVSKDDEEARYTESYLVRACPLYKKEERKCRGAWVRFRK